MNEQEAMQRVRDLLGAAASTLTDTDLTHAVRQAVTVDAAGRLPYTEGWIPTYEPFWAAGVAAQMLATRAAMNGGVTRWTSEGTTVERSVPDFDSAARWFFAQSPLTALAAGTKVSHIDVPTHGDYDPLSQGWRG